MPGSASDLYSAIRRTPSHTRETQMVWPLFGSLVPVIVAVSGSTAPAHPGAIHRRNGGILPSTRPLRGRELRGPAQRSHAGPEAHNRRQVDAPRPPGGASRGMVRELKRGRNIVRLLDSMVGPWLEETDPSAKAEWETLTRFVRATPAEKPGTVPTPLAAPTPTSSEITQTTPRDNAA